MTTGHRSAEDAGDVVVRPVADADMEAVLAIYAEGLATRNATFETELPTAAELRARWLPDLAWVAEVDGTVVGWTAVVPTSTRECYAGVGETSVYVAESARGRGVGHGAAAHPGHRGRRRRDVDAADLDLPREPRQPGAAPARPATGPSRSGPGSRGSTACGATRCCSSGGATSCERSGHSHSMVPGGFDW